MPLTTSFTLSKQYLEECFDESLPFSKHAKPRYVFIVSLLLSGLCLLIFTNQHTVAGSILLGLGVLETISFIYRRAWWLTRQMWSRSANGEVTIVLDEQGFSSKNPYTETTLLWQDIKKHIDTERGVILVANNGGQSYISKSVLTDEMIALIKERCY
ncbi:YcxB family protein [Motilimonas cestriensis]|uniref:YcxB family protein n=1 Tax=Motilimonas cestriensis TaxID=2742685 RepID=UPI003DA3C12F